MDLKTLILLLENKIKTKDFVLPYNSKSLDASTIQTLNQNLSSENLEKLISEVLQQNVKSVIKVSNTSSNNLSKIITNVEKEHENNEKHENHEEQNVENVFNSNQSLEMITLNNMNILDDNHNTPSSLDALNTVTNQINSLIMTESTDITTNVIPNKNILLFNFLMCSNKQVMEYVKMFSFAKFDGSTDLNTLTTVTNSYNQLINFLGYYKISSFFLEGIDEFSVILKYFKHDLSNAYYTYLHFNYNSDLNQLIASNKIISKVDYFDVVDNLEKSTQEFKVENEKILDKSNNDIDNLISQKRQRKIILSGLLMLGSYVILAKTGVPLLGLTKFLFSSSPLSPLSLEGMHGHNSQNLYSSDLSSTSLDNILRSNSSNQHTGSDNVRFRDLYDLALKMLYKKLKSMQE